MTVPATTDQFHVDIPRQATTIAPGMVCDTLSARNTGLKELPAEISARIRMDLTGSKNLTTLPDGLRTGSLCLQRCTGLETLPQGLDIVFLDLSECNTLKALPQDLRLRGGALVLRNCSALTKLPDNMGEVAYLDLFGCKGIAALPEGLTVTSWMNLTATGITDIPSSYQNVGLRSNEGLILTREEALHLASVRLAESR